MNESCEPDRPHSSAANRKTHETQPKQGADAQPKPPAVADKAGIPDEQSRPTILLPTAAGPAAIDAAGPNQETPLLPGTAPSAAGEIRPSQETLRLPATASSAQDESRTSQGTLPSAVRPRAAGDLLVAPCRFGKFDVTREIGRGGMGIVYEAFQRDLARRVALKVTRPWADTGKEAIERFVSEARAAAKLIHPGIVAIHEIGVEQDLHYFTMELIEGEALSSILAKGPILPRQALETMSQLARAVAYANDNGVIHRDLKPGNVIILKDGSAKITDFGLARDLTREGERLTIEGSIVGTPEYMSPEQARGDTDEIGPHSDVYSLGAVLYEMLVGKPVFSGKPVAGLLLDVISGTPTPIGQANPRVGRDVQTICMKCIEKEPRHRYQSAHALADDIDCCLRGEAITARPLGIPARTFRFVRRHKGTVVSTAAFAGILIGALAFFWYWLKRERALEESPWTQLAREDFSAAALSSEWDNTRSEARVVDGMLEIDGTPDERLDALEQQVHGRIVSSEPPTVAYDFSAPGQLLDWCGDMDCVELTRDGLVLASPGGLRGVGPALRWTGPISVEAELSDMGKGLALYGILFQGERGAAQVTFASDYEGRVTFTNQQGSKVEAFSPRIKKGDVLTITATLDGGKVQVSLDGAPVVAGPASLGERIGIEFLMGRKDKFLLKKVVVSGKPVSMERERFLIYSARAGENLSLSFDLAPMDIGNGDAYAFICGDRPGSGYCFRFYPARTSQSPDRGRAVLQREGMEVARAEPFSVNNGGTYRIEIAREENKVWASSDGRLILEYTDPDPLRGPLYERFGFGVTWARAAFDNVVAKKRSLALRISPLNVADRFYARGHYDEAIEEYREIIGAYPGQDVARVAAGRIIRCQEQLGSWEEAVIGLREALTAETAPDRRNDLAARILLGLTNLDRVAEAVAWWEEWKGRLHARTLANWILPRAARDLMQRLEGRGVSLAVRGKHGEARDCFTLSLTLARVLGMRQSASSCAYQLGKTLYALRRFPEALEDFVLAKEGVGTASARGDPGRSAIDIWIGNCWREIGDVERAVEAYRIGIAENPEDRVGCVQLSYWTGYACFHKGDFERARREWKNTATEYADVREGLYTLLIRADLGEASESELAARFKSSPEENDIYFHLGIGCEIKGDSEAAKGYYKKCLQATNPEMPAEFPAELATERLRRLERAEGGATTN